MPLPDIFKCPSDKSAMVPDLSSPNPPNVEPDTSFQTWKNWGTSYPINWYWSVYYQLAPDLAQYPVNSRPAIALGLYLHLNPKRPGIGAKMLQRSPTGGWESRFIIFYENLFNYTSQGARPQGLTNNQAKQYRGWHGQLNYHAASYLDGHADYRRRDTRYVEGPGWTTWPNRPYEGWNAP